MIQDGRLFFKAFGLKGTPARLNHTSGGMKAQAAGFRSHDKDD